MSDNPIRPFQPYRPLSAGPRVVMVPSDDSRRLVVILFSVALVLGAGIGILGFLAGRRSEVGKIHPPDFAPIPSAQTANPPPPPLQIVPLPEGSLVREEPPLRPGSPVVIGYQGGQPISIEESGTVDAAVAAVEKPAIEIRRHEPIRYRKPLARVPLAPLVAPIPAAAPDPEPDPIAAPIAAPDPVADSPEASPAPDPASAPAPAIDPPADPDPDLSLDSSLEPPPPPP